MKRKGLFSHEEMDVDVIPSEISAQHELIAESTMNALAGEEPNAERAHVESELVGKETTELVHACDAAATTCEIAVQLYDSAPTQPNFSSSAALDVAVEHLLVSVGAQARTKRFVAQEDFLGYPTQARLKTVAAENLESIKEAFMRLIARIRAICARVIAWFRQLFSRQRWRAKRLQERSKNLQNAFRQASNATPDAVAIKKPRSDQIYSDKIKRVLSINGQLPDPGSVVRGLSAHSNQMLALYRRFDSVSDQLLDAVEHAEKAVSTLNTNVDSAAAALSVGFNLLNDLKIGRDKGRAVASPSPTMHLYEEELTFGGMSLWHTGDTVINNFAAHILESAMPPSLQAYLRPSSGAGSHPSYAGEGVFPLDENQINKVTMICREHAERRAQHIVRNEKAIGKFGKIMDRAAALEKLAFDQKFTSERYVLCKLLLKLVSSTITLMHAIFGSLSSYDESVIDAAITYTEESFPFVFGAAPAQPA
jgi:hypothetical protein